jgi:DNA polymerase III sliding clamp (beta) subunit (PCNA family)
VADVLSAYGGEKVVVELKDKDTGALFSSGDRAREYYLVMPIDI